MALRRLLLFSWVMVLVANVSSTQGTHEKKLRDQLFVTSKYDKTVRPVLHPSQIINISFGIQLSKLVHLNTKHQLLVTDVWVIQQWTNPFLTWNESEYEGIHSIHIRPDDMWVPDTVLFNNGDEDTIQAGFLEKFKSHVILESSGLCIWMVPTTFKSSCEMDITNFPFDSQECEMTFGSWTYDSRLLQMEQLHETHVKTEKFVINGDWNIRDITIKKQEIKYICCNHPFSDITYTFILDRKPNYHVLYLIVPCVIISVISLLSFALPPDCGERVGLSITTLLAMSVYLLIMSDIIPETSDFVPRLGIYYITVMVLVAASLAATTITLRCHYNRNKPPKFLKKIFSCKQRDRRVSNVIMEDLTSCDANNINSDVIKNLEKEKSIKAEELEKLREEWRESWAEIAAGLDKVFFGGFVVVFIVASLGILMSRG